MKNPKVSIIIVNYSQRQLTLNCLKSIERITYPNYEIILVDNGSSDGSVTAIRNSNLQFTSSKLKIIQNDKNLGFTGGNNIGLKNATGKYILLLNNDTIVDKGFIEPLIEKFQADKEVGILQSKLLLMDKPTHLDNVASYMTSFGFLYHVGYLMKDKGQYDKFITSMSAKGASLIIRREVLSLGLFDDDYFAYFEETDLCWRAWIMGWRVGFEPDSVVYHKMGATSLAMESAFIQFHSFKNRIRTILKNASLTTILWMLPAHLISSFFISLYFLISGKVKVFVSVINAYVWNLVNLSKTLELRKRVQKSRKVSDREVFKYTFKNPPSSFYKSHLSLLTKSLK